MKALKLIVLVLVVYIGIVVTFESLLGYFQPENQDTLVITTSADGATHQRVVARLESNGQLYVAVNHWPRAWYRQALANPGVTVAYPGQTGNYLAVLVDGEEYDRVNSENSLGLLFRFLTGFPRRHLFRLDPR